ncbi:type II secretion system F family protein [Oribacterium sp. WCC10]|uniref:type II secretion system F family protein n=1 Tax=Oribacterium sp. WCC10 TaxID=1855343 RepID=UPI0008DF1069|nr:type II secretion system F family protein [Oribacterium sp. WCC10]SFG34055.1 type II secretion system protein F (GspF) [Oribacterium sp. WCC10]
MVSYTFYQSSLVFLLLLPLCFVYPFLIKKNLISKRRNELLLQFKEALSILSSFLSAGYSTENAFQASIPELKHMSGEKSMIVFEFEAIVNGLKLNKSLECMLSDFAYRSGLDDVSNFAEIFNVAKRNGGNLVNILTHTSGIIRDKVQIIEDIRTLNASKIYEQRIMNLIPFIIILYMNFTSPDFFISLYTTFLGRITMSVCLGIYCLSIYLANRILNIEV